MLTKDDVETMFSNIELILNINEEVLFQFIHSLSFINRFFLKKIFLC